MILDVQLPDNGEYVCSVTNREGTTLSNATTLSVIGKLYSSVTANTIVIMTNSIDY